MPTKTPERYFTVDPWHVIEEGFDPRRSRLSESMFCLANEFMGIRGYFEEGYSGDHLLGSYFNNLYEEMEASHPQLFKGIITRQCFGVNAVDWLYTRIWLDGEQLDLANVSFSEFSRWLDMKKGTLYRRFTWETASGKKLECTFVRFLNMSNSYMGCQRIALRALNFSGEITLRTGLDFSILHEIAAGWDQTAVASAEGGQRGINFWDVPRMDYTDGIVSVLGSTKKSDHHCYSGFRFHTSVDAEAVFVKEEKCAALEYTLPCTQGQELTCDKMVVNYWEKCDEPDAVYEKGRTHASGATGKSFEEAHHEHVAYWEQAWNDIDIVIDNDPEHQQGIRFSIFNLHQTYHGWDPNLNIPCKGLTAEVYYGDVFWDTETYCLPFYMFTNPQAAKNLLLYRHTYLPQACERAKELDCEGARYPMMTLDGTESCATWQHGDFEIHVSVAISYAIWHYVNVCKDTAFLYDYGLEVLLQVCRFYASHGEYSPKTGEFGLYGVMGPDEYHMNVNNNCYTNYMVKKTMEYTLSVIDEIRRDAPDKWEQVVKKVGLRSDEPAAWRDMARTMRIPHDADSGIYEQHDGYFDLPEVDVKNIPESQIPIYQHWAYIRIFRYNMIKQPDVLLLPLFFSKDFSAATKKANYEYYEARCIHESSLSPSVHSILANELGKKEDAWEFFKYMIRLDLDNYNKNSDQGLHVTSMSGAWLNIVYGFAGLRTDAALLSFRPSLPQQWNALSFKLRYQEAQFEVYIDSKEARFTLLCGDPVRILVYDSEYEVVPGGVSVALQQ